MKRIAILLLILLMMTSILVSCGKHPIEEFKELMEKEDNCLVTVTMGNSSLGEFTVAMKRDGNITYTPTFLTKPAKYTEVIDDVTYVYTQNDNGEWTKSVKQEEDNIFDMLFDEDFFDPDNYEKVDGKKASYRQKDDVSFAGVEDVVITKGKNHYTLEMTVAIEGVELDMEVVFSKFGKIELTLPDAVN